MKKIACRCLRYADGRLTQCTLKGRLFTPLKTRSHLKTGARGRLRQVLLCFKTVELETTAFPFCHLLEMQGSTYTRWGHNSCPSTAALIYKGSMAASYYTNKGDGANHLCLPFDPQYVPGVGHSGGSSMHGSEYQGANQVNSRKQIINNRNIPCAVCRVQMRSTALMIPAHNTCPHGWTREYYGFLMGAHHTHTKRNFICMDREMKTLPGHADNKHGNELFIVGTNCLHGLECPPYQVDKPITCTVCTK